MPTQQRCHLNHFGTLSRGSYFPLPPNLSKAPESLVLYMILWLSVQPFHSPTVSNFCHQTHTTIYSFFGPSFGTICRQQWPSSPRAILMATFWHISDSLPPQYHRIIALACHFRYQLLGISRLPGHSAVTFCGYSGKFVCFAIWTRRQHIIVPQVFISAELNTPWRSSGEVAKLVTMGLEGVFAMIWALYSTVEESTNGGIVEETNVHVMRHPSRQSPDWWPSWKPAPVRKKLSLSKSPILAVTISQVTGLTKADT
jgi:hypothetical protein